MALCLLAFNAIPVLAASIADVSKIIGLAKKLILL